MAKVYSESNQELKRTIILVMQKHHPMLAEHEVTIDALFVHELTHLELRGCLFDRETGVVNGAAQFDAAGRPKMSLRKHDWQLGGFAEVAKRWGSDSNEHDMAEWVCDKFGQYVMPWCPKPPRESLNAPA